MSTLLHRLQTDGFVDLGQIDPSIPTVVVASEFAKFIGAAVIADPEALQVSLLGSKPINTYGGNYGLRALPLHTDLAHWHRPPRYLMLRCVVGSPRVCTRVLHCRNLEPQIPRALMKRALFSPRRRLDGKMFLLHMLTNELFRWDELFLQPKNQPAVEALQRMLEAENGIEVANFVLDQPGHALLIDNWHALHGRSRVPESEAGRRLERVYMEEATYDHEDAT